MIINGCKFLGDSGNIPIIAGAAIGGIIVVTIIIVLIIFIFICYFQQKKGMCIIRMYVCTYVCMYMCNNWFLNHAASACLVSYNHFCPQKYACGCMHVCVHPPRPYIASGVI